MKRIPDGRILDSQLEANTETMTAQYTATHEYEDLFALLANINNAPPRGIGIITGRISPGGRTRHPHPACSALALEHGSGGAWPNDPDSPRTGTVHGEPAWLHRAGVVRQVQPAHTPPSTERPCREEALRGDAHDRSGLAQDDLLRRGEDEVRPHVVVELDARERVPPREPRKIAGRLGRDFQCMVYHVQCAIVIYS